VLQPQGCDQRCAVADTPLSARTDAPTNPLKLFFHLPLHAPLLFPNTSSDARDHAANERTYLSYVRLAVYLSVVSVAIFVNFHLKHQPTGLEEKIAHPLGIIFWLLSLACLVNGFSNYISTVAKYARKAAVVQSGLKTQLVFGLVSCAIIAACATFLAAQAQRESSTDSVAATQREVTVQSHIHAVPGTESGQSIQEEILRLLAEVGGHGVPDS